MKKRPGYSIRAALIIGVFAYAYYRTDNLYASGAAAGLILALKPFAKGIRRIRKKQKYKNKVKKTEKLKLLRQILLFLNYPEGHGRIFLSNPCLSI